MKDRITFFGRKGMVFFCAIALAAVVGLTGCDDGSDDGGGGGGGSTALWPAGFFYDYGNIEGYGHWYKNPTSEYPVLVLGQGGYGLPASGAFHYDSSANIYFNLESVSGDTYTVKKTRNGNETFTFKAVITGGNLVISDVSLTGETSTGSGVNVNFAEGTYKKPTL
jgi:hypothetical protein